MKKDGAILLLRLMGIGLAVNHGFIKIARFASGDGDRFVSGVAELGFPFPVFFAWAAALTEGVGGLFIVFGLATRIAAAFAAFTMFIAGFFRHHFVEKAFAWAGFLSVPDETLERWGNPEMALLYLLAFVALVLLGPGRYSLDYLLFKKSRG